MRIWTNGRGATPPLRTYSNTVIPGAIHCWTLDEANATDAAADLIGGGANLTAAGSPTVITPASAAPGGPSIGPGARRFNGSTQYFRGGTPGADVATIMASSGWTVYASFRLADSWSARGDIICYGAQGESLITNNLCHIYIDANRNLVCFWEHGAGVNVSKTFGDVTFEKNRWYHVAVVRDGVTRYLFVNGGLAQQSTAAEDLAAAYPEGDSSGNTQVWTLGCSETTVPSANFFNGDIDHVSVQATNGESRFTEDALMRMKLHSTSIVAGGYVGLHPFSTTVHWRVEVNSFSDGWVDLSDFYGVDWVSDVALSGNVDAAVETATIKLWRQHGELSLSLLNNNPANRALLPSSGGIGPTEQTYADLTSASTTELLTPLRGIRIYCCRLPIGVVPKDDDWQFRFDGVIRNPKAGADADTITVEAMDISSRIVDAWLIDAGLRFGGGILVEDVIQSILDWVGSRTVGGSPILAVPVTLAVEGTPAWTLTEYGQEPTSAMSAIEPLAEQMGWKVRTKFNHLTETFTLTLYEPNRLQRHTDMVLTEREYHAVTDIQMPVDDVRNVVIIKYQADGESASTTVPTIATGTTTAAVGTYDYDDGPRDRQRDASGNVIEMPATGVFQVTSWDLDSTEVGYTSIARFGVRVMMLTEAKSKGITKIAQAQAMAVGILRDLCLPKVQGSVDAFSLPELEVNDFIRIRANRLYTTSDMDTAVMEFTHSANGSSFNTRGAPSGGVKCHLEGEGRAGTAAPPATVRADTTGILSQRMQLGIMEFLTYRASGTPVRQGRRNMVANGNFAANNFGNAPPDGWVMYTGTWGTNASLSTSVLGMGLQSLKLSTGGSALAVASSFAQCAPGQVLELQMRAAATAASGTRTANLNVEFFDSAGASLGVTNALAATTLGTTFTKFHAQLLVPSGAYFFCLHASRPTGNTQHVYITDVDVTPRQPQVRAYLSTDTTTGLTAKVWAQLPLGDASTAPGGLDPAGLFDPVTTFRFTAPEEGWYAVSARAVVDMRSAGNGAAIALFKNGTQSMWSDIGYATSESDPAYYVTREVHAGDLYLGAGEYLEMGVYLTALPSGWAVKSGADNTFLSVRKTTVD